MTAGLRAARHASGFRSWPNSMTITWSRNNIRAVSGLILLAFVLCHLMAHSFLLVSLDRTEAALKVLMYPWRTAVGTAILVSALLAHFSNALWSIYVRRHLGLSRWQWWQLGSVCASRCS